ncbi:copper resistance protein CopD [Caulobacter sp. Root655]|uniref:copper homeostasis membrane protein CopD n=1 Tax=Caulobacter sp. Root655 TaxID=1736578 RepID=UPI0006FA7DF8|nr:copper homeostasis membrane protein CopD [Caulobacter sp. Root655]KRA60370.1 copper resistance protein CopD [Caulobacter sp. Root655]
MTELLVVLARLVQYAGAATLFGAPLFYLYGLPAEGPGAARSSAGTRGLVVVAGLLTAIGCGLALLAQTAMMTGALADALDPQALTMVATGTQFGVSVLSRATASLAVLALATILRSTSLWRAAAALGAVALASFAWSGHGADGEGAAGLFRLAADIVHLLAAGVWLGALAALLLLVLVARQAEAAGVRALHRALEGFSGVGALVVATLVLTGLVNSWFLVGPDHVMAAVSTAWGVVLLAKLCVFALMLGLAALNRFVLTPRLKQALAGLDPASALAALRRSLVVESAAGLSVVVLVSWLGTLAPPAAL